MKLQFLIYKIRMITVCKFIRKIIYLLNNVVNFALVLARRQAAA